VDDLPEIFDGRIRRPERRRRSPVPWIAALLLAAAAGLWFVREDLPIPGRSSIRMGPAKVVRQRPGGSRKASGATLNEPEAVMALRRHFIAGGIKSECIATVSRGSQSGAYAFDVIDRCQERRLGRWRVDGTTGAVSQ
jgi:hypothetical protein